MAAVPQLEPIGPEGSLETPNHSRHLTLVTGDADPETASPPPSNHNLQIGIGAKAIEDEVIVSDTKTFARRDAYLPGPPAWNYVYRCRTMVRGIVYPH